MKQYEYRLPKLPSIMLIFLLPMSWYGYHNAINHKNVSRHGMQLFSGTSATYFWWITAFIFLLLVLLGIYMLMKSFGEPKLIMLDNSQITAPTKPISNKIISIPYGDITGYKLHSVGKIRQITLKSPHGQIMIADNTFSNKSDFDEIVQTILQKIRI